MRLLTLALFLVLTAPIGAAAQDDRPDARMDDREAIRTHIDRIFQAFIKKDVAELRATHEQNWLGYLEGSGAMIRGVDGYMNNNYVDPASPYGYTAVVYSNYSYDLEIGGQRSQQTGRVTEVFVSRNWQWVNPGWHMDSGK